jgi:ATP-dependent DNA helicase RecQ
VSAAAARDAFQAIRTALRAGLPVEPAAEGLDTPIHRRLLSAMGSRHAGPADRAVLLRHLLRREELLQGGVEQPVLLSGAERWPAPGAWQAFGVVSRDSGAGEVRVRAEPWRPTWLPHADRHPVGEPAFAEEERRTFDSVTGDPFLGEMGLDHYRCEAQREMVRAVLTSEPGATLLLNLPTGAGKSLCALLPALLMSRTGGVAVVVVPTTALALDQESAIVKYVAHATAYYGGSGADGETRRAGIRQRIVDGTQRVVFCSPESVVGPLREPLRRAAEQGWLRMLVIDEAHIVDEWGSEFRSEFQVLAGARRDLLRACGGPAFRTVLMTATLTESCLDTLEVLFGRDGSWEVISAVQLRPEPEFWACWCESEEVKVARVMEALHHLPRPLILYTTRVQDAEAWRRRLLAAGFHRTAAVTGATPADERARVIRQWRAAEVDVICATSAFGLGMDQADVRAVVHACVPESVDRFYQEVGRAGRDGSACVSLAVFTNVDLGDAERMSQHKLITLEKGLPRWQRMFDAATSLDSGRYRLPVDVSPGVDEERLDMLGERNEAWNVRTLTLMARAGLLELDAESDAGDADPAANPGRTRVVRILDEDHRSRARWEQRIQPLRYRSYATGGESVERLRNVLFGRRCAAEVFAEAYTLRRRGPGSPGAAVARCCSGCPFCRVRGIPPMRSGLPVPAPRAAVPRITDGELARLFTTGDVLAIFDDVWERSGTERLYRWLLSLGVRAVVLPPELPPARRVPFERVLRAGGEAAFVSDRFVRRHAPRVPTLIVHAPGADVPAHHLRDGGAEPFPRILFLPLDAADPENPERRLWDVISCRKYLLGEFLAARSL